MISLRSKVTKKLLSFFFLNPRESLYLNELVERLSLDKRNLVKKLNELEKEGILNSQKRGNLRLYSINKDYLLYNEYKKIVFKATGIEESLKKALSLKLKEKGSKKEYKEYIDFVEDMVNKVKDIIL